VLLAILTANAQDISVAGGTFPAPLYQRWLASFQASHPGLSIHYDAVGSTEGVKRLRAHQIDFAASDIPVDDESLESIPTVIGAVVPIYHLPGVTHDLRLTPEALAGIFLGRIHRWNDPQIKDSNRKVTLPAADIGVVHRSDGSGTTFVWSSFLAGASVEWKSNVGSGGTVVWPVGRPAEANEGVAREVQNTAFSIGYVEFIYAVREHLSYAAVRNAAGRFVQPDTESIRIAAADPHRPEAYPIPAMTYFVIPRKMESAEKRTRIAEFLNWMLSSGQNDAAALGFIALPPEQLLKAKDAVAALR
jgi:phosphate transport system substrate-binding protein